MGVRGWQCDDGSLSSCEPVPPQLQPWAPLSRDAAAGILEATGIRWWFTGGHALELHLGRSWREHVDVDVGVLRSDGLALAKALSGWDVRLAAAGRLSELPARPLQSALHENNLWVRTRASGPWCLDVTISEGNAETWRYRRRRNLCVPWSEAVLVDPDGLPYLAPDLQLLHKSVSMRAKDDIDASVVIPTLGPRHRDRLTAWLAPEHPWQVLLEASGGRIDRVCDLRPSDRSAPTRLGRRPTAGQARPLRSPGGRV